MSNLDRIRDLPLADKARLAGVVGLGAFAFLAAGVVLATIVGGLTLALRWLGLPV